MSAEKCFLIVESDADLRFAYRRTLVRAFPGCNVLEAESCASALQQLAHAEVDAAVVNQVATDLKGLALLQRIRKERTTLPIISIGEDTVKNAMVGTGATAFLPSSQVPELGALMKRVLGR